MATTQTAFETQVNGANPFRAARRALRAELTVTLIIPALNEAAGLEAILPRIPGEIDEVIIVDGGSSDRTTFVIEELCPRARYLQQESRGKGGAIQEGLALASGDIVVTMDADGSMKPEDIPAFLDRLLDGHDFVKGSRELETGGSSDFTFIRRMGNILLTRVANVIFGTSYTDITYGYNAYWRETMVNPRQLSQGFEFEIQAAIRAAKAGLRTAEVGCYEEPRVGGHSKLNALHDGWAILRVILQEALPRRVTEFRHVADFYVER